MRQLKPLIPSAQQRRLPRKRLRTYGKTKQKRQKIHPMTSLTPAKHLMQKRVKRPKRQTQKSRKIQRKNPLSQQKLRKSKRAMWLSDSMTGRVPSRS